MEHEGLGKSLADAAARLAADKTIGRGTLPIKAYWFIRINGEKMAELRTVHNYGMRALERHFDVHASVIRTALEFLQSHEKEFVEKDWDAVERILFKNWPHYKIMPSYKEGVAGGYQMYLNKFSKNQGKVKPVRADRTPVPTIFPSPPAVLPDAIPSPNPAADPKDSTRAAPLPAPPSLPGAVALPSRTAPAAPVPPPVANPFAVKERL